MGRSSNGGPHPRPVQPCPEHTAQVTPLYVHTLLMQVEWVISVAVPHLVLKASSEGQEQCFSHMGLLVVMVLCDPVGGMGQTYDFTPKPHHSLAM
jgi:hypothetical protein